MLMGLTVGQITRMEPMPPEYFQYNIYVEFEIKAPYYGYLWTEGSRAKVATAEPAGQPRAGSDQRHRRPAPTYIFNPLREVTLAEAQEPCLLCPTGCWPRKSRRYGHKPDRPTPNGP